MIYFGKVFPSLLLSCALVVAAALAPLRVAEGAAQAIQQAISADLQAGVPRAEAIRKAMMTTIDAGLALDQAAEYVLQQYPDAVGEVERAVLALMQIMPYAATCDDCVCSAGSALVQYPLAELAELERKEWVEEVVRRYRERDEELLLPNLGEENPYPFFFHFETELASLRPYLGDVRVDPQDVAAMVRQIEERGLIEPVRFVLTSLGEGPHVYQGQVLVAAAEQLGRKQLPVRFTFTECAICENRSDAAYYSLHEMREYNSLEWTRQRFFIENEVLLIDQRHRPESDRYPFDYHAEVTVKELLDYFVGDADSQQVEQWRERLEREEELRAIPITLNHGAKDVEFGTSLFPIEQIHALLTAAEELQREQLPVIYSFQDQITCRAGMQRTTFSAAELFPEQRIPVVAQRFFEQRRRMVHDEAGRHRETRIGYPFAGLYPYHFMGKVRELADHLPKEKVLEEEEINQVVDQLLEEGVARPIYLRLVRTNEEQGFIDESIRNIVGASHIYLAYKLEEYLQQQPKQQQAGSLAGRLHGLAGVLLDAGERPLYPNLIDRLVVVGSRLLMTRNQPVSRGENLTLEEIRSGIARLLVSEPEYQPLYQRAVASSGGAEVLYRSIQRILAEPHQKFWSWDRLPVRVLYINHPHRDRTICDWVVRRTLDQYRNQLPPLRPPRPESIRQSGGDVSPS